MQGASHISVQAKYQDILSLAQEALPVIGGIVTRLGIDTLNPELGELGALLCTLAADTSSHNVSVARQHVLGIKLEYVLDQVEKWPGYQETKGYPMLKAIVAAKASQASKSIRSTMVSAKLEKDIRSGLKKYVLCSPEYKVLVQEIQGFSTMGESEPADWIQEASSDIMDKAEIVPDYPLHVNKVLYRALFPHLSSCFCENGKEHDIRLRLKPQEDKEDEGLLRFEMLFSVPSVTPSTPFSLLWQESKILVPSRKKARKHVSFLDSVSPEPSSPPPSSRVRSEEIRPGDFCKLLCLRAPTILSFIVNFQMLRKLDEKETPRKEVESKKSMSLLAILKTRSMSRKAKCVLAYTLAKSVWQYYGSGWMNTPWTHENIHLLDDQLSGARGPGKGSYSCRPYLVAKFHPRLTDIPEYCAADSVVHQYPNVLALGILLIEIARGEPLASSTEGDQPLEYHDMNINHFFKLAWNSMNDLGEVDFETYAEAVRRCLDLDLFAEAPFSPENDAEEGIQHRRDILYRQIVSPLKKLLEGTGWLSDLGAIKQEAAAQTDSIKQPPAPSKHPRSTETKPQHTILTEEAKVVLDSMPVENLTPLPIFLGTQRKWTPESWLKKVDSINRRMAASRSLSHGHGAKPIRIAILDTGCDFGAPIFSVTEHDNHIRRHWRDWVENSREPKDNNGHGTKIAAILLRIAPNAEVFVGRVAKDHKNLQNAAKNISEAIIHAATVWDADIVSLSFGFPAEITDIRNAIRQAEIIKNDSIIFFAAAGNEGSNSCELFPAYSESVISIRGTDSEGAFVHRFNPPPVCSSSENHFFGILGQDVPYDWPDEDPNLKMSGCSVAAPVAAGIAALILHYAASCSELDEKEQMIIKSRRGMVQVFKNISAAQGNNRFYILPWNFFTEEKEGWLTLLRSVIRELPRSL